MAVKGAPFFGAFIEAKRRPFTATAAEATARQRAGKLAAPNGPGWNAANSTRNS